MKRALVLVPCALLAAAGLRAQVPPPVAPGWGVDTTGAVAWTDTAGADVVREIFRRWAQYLGSNPGRQEPTSLWTEAEQHQWRQYDLTSGFAYQGFPATVLEISPAEPGSADRYLVKTLFASAPGEPPAVKPIALTRVYALREHGEWVFSNALPYLTRGWREERVGPFRYVLEPGYPFDRGRARAAVAFADSLAAAYQVPRLDSVTYYLAGSPERALRILGVEWTVPGGGYGYANAWNRLIVSGTPAVGENNRHELVHFLLAPVTAVGRTHPLIGEGVASWLGGSMGRTFPQLMREYATYLRRHPEVTLDSVLEDAGPDRGVRPAGAELARMVFEARGVAGVKQLLASGRSTAELKQALTIGLAMSWADVAARWRMRCLAYGP